MEIANAILTEACTRILNSFLVKTKAEMRAFLEDLRAKMPEQMAVNQRDIESQIREWRSHNLFYKFHVFRSRTKDVDLELQQPWYRELFCRIMDFLYFWD